MLHTTLQRLSYHDRSKARLNDLIARLPRAYQPQEQLPFDVILNAIAIIKDPFTFTNNLWFLQAEHQHVNLYRQYAIKQIKKTKLPENPYPDILEKTMNALEGFSQSKVAYDDLLRCTYNAGLVIPNDPVLFDLVNTARRMMAVDADNVRQCMLDARFNSYEDIISGDTLTTIRGAALLDNNYQDYAKAIGSTTYDLTTASVMQDFTEKYLEVSRQQRQEMINWFEGYRALAGEVASPV